jgi:hypothetical protein
MVAASTDGQNLVVEQHRPDKVAAAAADTGSNDTPKPDKIRRPSGKGHFQLVTPAVVGLITAWWPVLQTRVVQIRYRAGVAAA